MPRTVPKVAVDIRAAARAALPALLSLAFGAVATVASAADNPPAAPAAAAPAGATAPATAADAKAVEERRQRVEALAMRNGYRPMMRDGARMYCTEEDVTASRVRKQRSCVTEEQMELHLNLEKETAREILDKGLRGFTPRTP